MKPQFANQVLSSTLLWMDNLICTKGQAFINQSGYFYPMSSLYNNYYTYAAPYSQLIADSSISGATIMTGIYLDGSFLGTGQSGFFNIDYERGYVYFSSEITGNSRLSGNYAVKEIDVKLTTDPEEVILFEKKHFYKLRTPENLTGLANNEITFPAIYLKIDSQHNKPFQLGGTDETYVDIRATLLCESQYQLDAIKSIISDQKYNYVPLLNEAEFPFNNYGGLRTGYYNYTGVTANKTKTANSMFIDDAFVPNFSQHEVREFNSLNISTFIGFADLTLCYPRNPRQ